MTVTGPTPWAKGHKSEHLRRQHGYGLAPRGTVGDAYSLLVAPGTWWVRGFVDVPGSSGLTQSTSSAVEIHLSAGQNAKENFAVTY